MNSVKRLTTCLLILSATPFAALHAQDFGTPSRYASNWYGSGTARTAQASYGRLVASPYTAPREFLNRPASYRVERDPRYMPALASRPASPYASPVTSYRPPYSGVSRAPIYRGQGPSGYAPALRNSANTGYRGYALPPAKSPNLRYRVPEGYYRGDGLFGKDTVFAENQPVRNFFRYVLP